MIKTDSFGLMEWNKTYGGSNDESSRSVIQTSDMGILVTGGTESYGNGKNDILLMKTDFFGNELWRKTFGGRDYDYAFSVIEAEDNTYLLTGYTTSYYPSNSDLWIIKTNMDGEIIWNLTFGGCDDETGRSIVQAKDGGFLILGETGSWGNGWMDVWLLKLDENGHEEWNRTFGDMYFDMGISMDLTDDNGCILSAIHADDIFAYCELQLYKIDENGSLEWDQCYHGPFDDVGFSIFQTEDQGYFVGGYTDSYGAGWSDMYLLKTNEYGVIEWQTTLGGINADVCYACYKTNEGGCVVVGFTNSYGKGGFDAWFIKLGSICNLAPEIPISPKGPRFGMVGVNYSYSTYSYDADGDQLWYLWDWGDSTQEDWMGPYISDEICKIKHSWNKTGSYAVKVKTKDTHSVESEWSEPLIVYMPKSKQFFNSIPFFKTLKIIHHKTYF